MASRSLPFGLLLFALLRFGTAESSSLTVFWEQELPNAAMPDDFEKLASPMSSSDVQRVLSKISAGLLDQSFSSEDECTSAGVYCPGKALVIPIGGPQPRVCIPPFFDYEYAVLPCRSGSAEVSAVQASGIFFSQRDLTVSKKMQLPDTSNDLQGMKFLPSALASALPELEAGRMQDFVRFYGVQTGSDMELEMRNTFTHCEFKSTHEMRACHVAAEGVVSFASEFAGHNAAVVTAPAMSKQEVTIMGIDIISKPGNRAVSCHNMKFPSLMYSCHMTQSAQLMDVSVKLENGHLAHMPVICHMDTSYWNPAHVAFQALNAKPGSSSVCHWFPDNTFIFIGKDNL